MDRLKTSLTVHTVCGKDEGGGVSESPQVGHVTKDIDYVKFHFLST